MTIPDMFRRKLRGKAKYFSLGWGNATFAHNMRGTASSIRAGLIRRLSQKFSHMFLVDEFRTSAMCSCCHERMRGVQIPGKLERMSVQT